MSRRSFKRDRQGRFAGAGSKIGSTAKGAKSAANTAAKTYSKKVGKSVGNAYVNGSFEKHLVVGQGGDYKGVKVGAEFRSPAGRGVVVKGIAGYHGKPNRRLDVTPSLDKAQKQLTVTAKPNPARRSAAAGRKVRQ
ncbi:hypothetical protein [Tsukamurella pseudospumae]|uniref:50S ribosomal protein L27 n=1 Tax=Tsukamurella pseudospumae TaxID=239498 RepID=A0A137YZF0_9ACTN|nr:hypothetical protein [Tsukamurella pseudospumae]KXO91301.1 hypothetical protein AXK61_07035 [Tsukamurella pseudospumae]